MKLFTLRDGQNRIVGTTTSCSNGDTIARDRSGSILGEPHLQQHPRRIRSPRQHQHSRRQHP
jgi:hypothetical protein